MESVRDIWREESVDSCCSVVGEEESGALLVEEDVVWADVDWEGSLMGESRGLRRRRSLEGWREEGSGAGEEVEKFEVCVGDWGDESDDVSTCETASSMLVFRLLFRPYLARRSSFCSS